MVECMVECRINPKTRVPMIIVEYIMPRAFGECGVGIQSRPPYTRRRQEFVFFSIPLLLFFTMYLISVPFNSVHSAIIHVLVALLVNPHSMLPIASNYATLLPASTVLLSP